MVIKTISEISRSAEKKKIKQYSRNQYPGWVPYLFISPFFIGFAIFSAIPILYSFYISLTEWSGFDQPRFIGLGNYGYLLHDELFYTALKNTAVIVTIFIPVMVGLGLIIAFLLYMGYIKGRNFFQTIYFLPYITTPVAVGMLFQAMFNWQYGFINKLLVSTHILSEPLNWLNTAAYSRPLISSMVIWQSVGYCVVMVMAGFKGVSKEVFESATVDGANSLQTFWKIAVPLVKPIIMFLVITTMIWGLQLFDETYLLFGPSGGPEYSALTLVSYLYTTAFTDGHSGYGAALGYALSIIIIICTLAMRKVFQEKED